MPFQDIKITGFDDKASKPVKPGSPFVRVVLTLSASAPTAWCEYFNDRWKGHLYMMKRRAFAAGDSITIDCVLEELEGDHLPELKKVVAETNEEYGKYHAQKERERAQAAAQEVADKAKLADLKKKLKFD